MNQTSPLPRHVMRLEPKSRRNVAQAFKEWLIERAERAIGPELETILDNYTGGLVKRKVGREALAEFEARPMATGDPLNPGWMEMYAETPEIVRKEMMYFAYLTKKYRAIDPITGSVVVT